MARNPESLLGKRVLDFQHATPATWPTPNGPRSAASSPPPSRAAGPRRMTVATSRQRPPVRRPHGVQMAGATARLAPLGHRVLVFPRLEEGRHLRSPDGPAPRRPTEAGPRPVACRADVRLSGTEPSAGQGLRGDDGQQRGVRQKDVPIRASAKW